MLVDFQICISVPLGLTEAAITGVFRKRCFENMQQIYRRTLMPKCDFAPWHECSPVDLSHILIFS